MQRILRPGRIVLACLSLLPTLSEAAHAQVDCASEINSAVKKFYQIQTDNAALRATLESQATVHGRAYHAFMKKNSGPTLHLYFDMAKSLFSIRPTGNDKHPLLQSMPAKMMEAIYAPTLQFIRTLYPRAECQLPQVGALELIHCSSMDDPKPIEITAGIEMASSGDSLCGELFCVQFNEQFFPGKSPLSEASVYLSTGTLMGLDGLGPETKIADIQSELDINFPQEGLEAEGLKIESHENIFFGRLYSSRQGRDFGLIHSAGRVPLALGAAPTENLSREVSLYYFVRELLERTEPICLMDVEQPKSPDNASTSSDEFRFRTENQSHRSAGGGLGVIDLDLLGATTSDH